MQWRPARIIHFPPIVAEPPSHQCSSSLQYINPQITYLWWALGALSQAADIFDVYFNMGLIAARSGWR